MAAPVETKVQASTAAAALSGLALWALGTYVFKGSGVPDVVASWVYVLVPGLLAFVAGYLARHTPVPGPVSKTPTTRVHVPESPAPTMPPTASQSVTPPPQGAAAEKLGGTPE